VVNHIYWKHFNNGKTLIKEVVISEWNADIWKREHLVLEQSQSYVDLKGKSFSIPLVTSNGKRMICAYWLPLLLINTRNDYVTSQCPLGVSVSLFSFW
jgi:hypothetical protein